MNWTTLPGRVYRVDYKPDLDAATWTPLGPPVRAVNSATQFIDTPAPERQKFYRAVLLR